MDINKKDIKRTPQNILDKAKHITCNLNGYTSQVLNIDRDLRSIKINDQYRLLYRQSTRKECRVVCHNVYNKLISNTFIRSIV